MIYLILTRYLPNRLPKKKLYKIRLSGVFEGVYLYIYHKEFKKGVVLKMVPERLEFLNGFDKFYQGLVRDVKENRVTEADFYMILGYKCKALDRERRERVEIKVKVVE